MTAIKLDIGCGPNKAPGHTGIDIYPYPGVDIVYDVTQPNWPLADNSCEEINASHVIEHIPNLVGFFREVHRIGQADALIHIKTPHYSSRTSWGDPTHVHHLSADFANVIATGYLSAQIGRLEVVSNHVRFSSSLIAQFGRLAYFLLGAKRWEKHLAFIFPATEIRVALRIKKT